jgi:hypothetical protein
MPWRVDFVRSVTEKKNFWPSNQNNVLSPGGVHNRDMPVVAHNKNMKCRTLLESTLMPLH